MLSDYNPNRIFLDVMRLKYRLMLPSIALIVVCFVLNFFVESPVLRYLAAVALLGYFVVFFAWRLRRLVPPDEPGTVLAPLCGKVTAVEEHATERVVVIRKGLFAAADVRSATPGETAADTHTLRNSAGDASWHVASGIFHLLDDRPALQGKLIGVLPFGGECRVTLAKTWKITVKPGESVSAGETTLGTRDEASSDSA